MGKKSNPDGECLSIPVNLIRTFAIVLVILFHAATETTPVTNLSASEALELKLARDIYNSISQPGVPLFLMLSGALLLQPTKLDESLGVFFKKRAIRIGPPFLFWGIIYFLWRIYVNGEVLTTEAVLQGALNGPYFHFWYFYALIGIYLLTPVLRIMVTYIDRKTFTFLAILWFLGTAVVPLIGLFGAYQLSGNVFILTGWVGYFLLGAYALKVHIRSRVLFILLFLGFVYTTIGTYFAGLILGPEYGHFFVSCYSFSMIGISLTLFMLLTNISVKTIETKIPFIKSLLTIIGQNTIFIFLFHVMVLQSLQMGFFGFRISITTMNPFIEVPLITAVTLLICIAVVYPLQKIPVINKIIGSSTTSYDKRKAPKNSINNSKSEDILS
ncbi:MAG: acyltransferase [Candidatus Bathyarchaeota archaeon]|nr:MAG: acyltransferase [Candidatus Bathyarchaeota archaeon]